tara:strand:+ start:249 stop:569 length:321 start_codon:yes stop_codon:yes gene_type:complete
MIETRSVIDIVSPTIQQWRADKSAGTISSVHLTFDTRHTALKFPRWLNLLDKDITENIKARDDVKLDDCVLVLRGNDLNTAEYMSSDDAKGYKDSNSLELKVIDDC